MPPVETSRSPFRTRDGSTAYRIGGAAPMTLWGDHHNGASAVASRSSCGPPCPDTSGGPRRRSACRRRAVVRGSVAAPALTPSGRAVRARVRRGSPPPPSWSSWRRRSAWPGRSRRGSTTNSSPANRAHTSYTRRLARRTCATSRSARSPAWWPNSSLICLKRSMSSRSTDSGRRCRWARASSWAKCRSRYRRFGQPGQRRRSATAPASARRRRRWR